MLRRPHTARAWWCLGTPWRARAQVPGSACGLDATDEAGACVLAELLGRGLGAAAPWHERDAEIERERGRRG